jgi:hypothetical protein
MAYYDANIQEMEIKIMAFVPNGSRQKLGSATPKQRFI